MVWRHALRNSLLPVVTMAGLSLPHVVSGSVVIERVFGLPGMGLLAFEAIGSRDYPTVMGVATLMALVTMASMLVIDLSYFLIDPRVRIGARARGASQRSPAWRWCWSRSALTCSPRTCPCWRESRAGWCGCPA